MNFTRSIKNICLVFFVFGLLIFFTDQAMAWGGSRSRSVSRSGAAGGSFSHSSGTSRGPGGISHSGSSSYTSPSGQSYSRSHGGSANAYGRSGYASGSGARGSYSASRSVDVEYSRGYRYAPPPVYTTQPSYSGFGAGVLTGAVIGAAASKSQQQAQQQPSQVINVYPDSDDN
jgi:hypothetical protein